MPATRDGAAYWLTAAGLATVGFNGIRSGIVTLSDLCFSAAALVIAVNLLSGARRRLAERQVRATSPSLLLGMMLLTMGGLLAAMLRSLDPLGTALALLRIWYITVVWFWTIRSVSRSVWSFQRLVLAAAIGATVHAGIGIFQDVSGANAGAPSWGRSLGYSDHMGDFASSVATLVPVVAVWPTAGRGRNYDLLRAGVLVIMLGGIASSGSMTILAASFVGLAVAYIVPRALRAGSRTRRRNLVPVLGAGLAALVLASGVVQLSVFERFDELMAGNSGARASAESRGDMSKVAIDGFVASPLVGVGLDTRSGQAANTFTTTTREVTVSIHSLYLRLLFEAGVLGLLGLLTILFVSFRQGYRIVQMTRGSPIAWLSAGLIGGMVSISFAALFGPVIYSRILWLPMALMSALAGLAKSGQLRPSATRTPLRPPDADPTGPTFARGR